MQFTETDQAYLDPSSFALCAAPPRLAMGSPRTTHKLVSFALPPMSADAVGVVIGASQG